MTHLLLLLPLLAGQTESPSPAAAPPPVLRMEGSTAPAADVPAAEAAQATAPPPAPGTRGAPVFLTINANRTDVQLLRADDGAAACDVPCNRLVPAGPKDKYYLGGKGLTNSNDFDLAEGIKAAQIDVRAGTKLGKIMGIILTAVGIPMLLSGALSMVSFGILSDPAIQARLAANGTQTLLSPTVTLVIAIVELVVGVGAGTTGLILWPTNSTVMTVKAVAPPGPSTVETPVATPPVEPPPSEAP